MKSKMNIKSILLMALISLSVMLFINISFAANTAKITVETAKLREKPSLDSKVLELASEGEDVEVIEKTGEWYKVKYKRITGYIRQDLLKVKEEVEANIVKNTTETSNTENKTEQEPAPNETQENNQSNSQENQQDNNQEESNNNENEPSQETVSNVETSEEIKKGEKYIIVNDSKLKIIPLITAIEMEEVKKDEEVEVKEIINKWAYIEKKDGKKGWIVLENLQTKQPEKVEETTPVSTQPVAEKPATPQTKKMYINSQTVNLRKTASKTASIVTQLSVNQEVAVISTESGWCYVEVGGKKGYILETLLSSTKQSTSRSSINQRATTKTNATTETDTANKNSTTGTTTTQNTTPNTPVAETSSKGNDVVSYAKQYLGCKYVYGGTTPKGFDCSGFTQYVYKHFGVNLNRTAAAQYSNGISVTNLQAGDLVMFGKSGINHVGIYIGGNTFIHAENSKTGVRTSLLSSSYYKNNYVGARRIF